MQSVIAIQQAIAAGKQTPRQAIARCFDTIAANDGELRAIRHRADREAVLAAADKASGPLAGIGVGVKDIFDSHDMETGYGSPIYDGFRPRADAAVVAMARRAGASIVAKTATTEFAFLHPTDTRNPHDHAHTPGGSSSGSAAAVAAGMLPAAFGTQTGGSVIRPAAYCGIAGYKPSFRLLPATGMKTFAWTLDTTGVFAAGVADAAAFVEGLSGRELTPAAPSLQGLRIALYRSAIDAEADQPMRNAVARAAALATEAGAIVTEVEEPAILADAREAHATVQNYEAALSLGSDYALHNAQMSGVLSATLESGRAITPDAYDKARAIARRARHAATALFDDCDVLLLPSATGAAPKGLESTGNPVFAKLWTMTGNPSLNVPGLKDTSGLPLGVQMVARFGRDDVLLSAGAALQSCLN
ncbi:MAG: amidase [Brucellaceae bacterium]|nr:amidase [Brucellaceae bacterium]